MNTATKLAAAYQPHTMGSDWYVSAMEHLVYTVQALSQARTTQEIAAIVRSAARELTGADGATFVLRDGDRCHYVDENAIAPLWKGKRFPMEICISGWVMKHAKPVTIDNIYNDARIPVEAYRPTFVKSLAMVPIRRNNPIGAIGNYWAYERHPKDEEIAILQALADTTAVALENVNLYDSLQTKIQALQESNYELARYTWVASHDLREPLRTIVTQIELLERRYGNQLDDRAKKHILTATQSASRLHNLVNDLLVHAQAEKIEAFVPVDLNLQWQQVLQSMQTLAGEARATIHSGNLPTVMGRPSLIARVLQNLLSNAIKFRRNDTAPVIEIAAKCQQNEWVISFHDNGIGIEEAYRERIFGLFERLYSQDVYPGSGIGLSTCKKIIELHNGRIWVESTPGRGSTFYFTLPPVES